MMLSPRTNPGQGNGPTRYPGTFLLAFREAVAGLKWTVQRWLGDAIDCLDAAGHSHVVGLENLFRRAKRGRDVLPRSFFKALEARRVRGAHKAPAKKLVSLRLDPDVLDKFRATGPGWPSRMNDALRKAVDLK